MSTFKSGDEVRIVSCEDDARAAGRTGRIVDEVPPGPLTKGRWTVNRVGLLIGPVLCHTHELQKTGR
ncbi:hypothetical protein OOK43_20425 [[Kitasatospora] papulosa]|uniref:hypothetical protein n=1 Tax=[Kitasatospora] papulosa TaxID=1464011 RepID=UPI00224D6119|nr:hypothetical protein [[Kitasatospora] papulosa]MCX4415631.1 hypothetical protein [[Kitasatospora] papulosa]